MKEIYDYRFEYKMDGWKNFVDTSIWKHVRYLTPEEAQPLNFTIKSFEVRCVYNKMSMSMKGLADTLDADSFCEYLRDRGITKI